MAALRTITGARCQFGTTPNVYAPVCHDTRGPNPKEGPEGGANPKEGPVWGVGGHGPTPRKLSIPSHVGEGQTAGSREDCWPAGSQQENPWVLGQNTGAPGLNWCWYIPPDTGLEPNMGGEEISGTKFTEEELEDRNDSLPW